MEHAWQEYVQENQGIRNFAEIFKKLILIIDIFPSQRIVFSCLYEARGEQDTLRFIRLIITRKFTLICIFTNPDSFCFKAMGKKLKSLHTPKKEN